MKAIEALSRVGEGLRELGVETDRESSVDVVITVRGSGPGLESTSLDRLFDPFYTPKPSGMGMGLSISRSIPEAQRGRQGGSPSASHGTMCQFSLPVAAPALLGNVVPHRSSSSS